MFYSNLLSKKQVVAKITPTFSLNHAREMKIVMNKRYLIGFLKLTCTSLISFIKTNLLLIFYKKWPKENFWNKMQINDVESALTTIIYFLSLLLVNVEDRSIQFISNAYKSIFRINSKSLIRMFKGKWRKCWLARFVYRKWREYGSLL